MKIDVQKVAKLANLTLSPEEEKEFDTQLNSIVGYIEKLNLIQTNNVTPTTQVTGLKNKTRNDNFADDTLSQDEALSGAQNQHNGLFVVDKLVNTT